MTTYEVAVKETRLVVYRVDAADPCEARLNASAKGDKTFEAAQNSLVWYTEEVP